MFIHQPWMRCADDLHFEMQQCREEGKDVADFEAQAEKIRSLPVSDPQREKAARAFYEKMQQLPLKENYPYQEPDELEAIRALRRPAALPDGSMPEGEALQDKIWGGWLGRSAGCLLGQPVEGWKQERIVGLLKETGNYPIQYYISSNIPKEIRDKYGVTDEGHVYGSDHINWINNVQYMPEDDDTNYTIIALKLLETYGREFTPEDVAECWLANLPLLHTCTAERVAYRNLAALRLPHESATFCNPYREWIGAQIRGDLFGYVNPGCPEKAAEMAWRDASISHVKNGIYGEMFAAAMIAAVFVTDSVRDIVEAGLGEIPHTSRLYEEIRRVLEWKDRGMDGAQALKEICTRYNENNPHDWAHTNSNAMIVTASLLFGEGDFERSIGMAVETGFDTDCNGATVGSVLGVALGKEALPAKWIDPLRDTIKSGVDGFGMVRISDLARRTQRLIG